MKNTILAVVMFFALLLCSCTKQKIDSQSRQVLGTICTINAFEDGTEQLYNQLFERLNQIEQDFSVRISTSQVSQINQAAGINSVEVTDDVLYVIKKSLYYAEISNGAFDPTVGPLVDLWGINTDHERIPSQNEIDNVLGLINWKDVQIEQNRVFLKRKGMKLDLGGIAKGYAADEMTRILSELKVHRAIIDLGGNIIVYGKKKDNSPWKVGVRNPSDDEAPPALVISLKGGETVVTSGVYERFFIQENIRYHHILDVKTGYPVDTDVLSSTIIAKTSVDADALSSIAFILGIDLFKELNIVDIDYIFINSNKTVKASQGLKDLLSPNSSEFYLEFCE